MKLTKLLAAMGLILVLGVVAGPAAAAPPDKGPGSKDCSSADVRATRIDRDLCATKAVAQTNRFGAAQPASAVAHGHGLQRWALVVLVGIVITGGATILALRRSPTTT